MATPVTLDTILQFLKKVGELNPQLFTQIVTFCDELYQKQTGTSIPVQPSQDPNGPLDVSAEDGTGSHTLISTGLDDDVRRAIREGVARGIILEKAAEWAAGFITSFMLRA